MLTPLVIAVPAVAAIAVDAGRTIDTIILRTFTDDCKKKSESVSTRQRDNNKKRGRKQNRSTSNNQPTKSDLHPKSHRSYTIVSGIASAMASREEEKKYYRRISVV